MSLKRKEDRLPCKLTAYMYQPSERCSQNGAAAGSLHSQLEAALSPHCDKPALHQKDPLTSTSSRRDPLASPPGTPASSSPAKAKMRLDAATINSEVSHISSMSSMIPIQSPQPDYIAAFPTVGQVALDITFKDMLVSLRGSLQSDMLSLMQRFSWQHSCTGGQGYTYWS